MKTKALLYVSPLIFTAGLAFAGSEEDRIIDDRYMEYDREPTSSSGSSDDLSSRDGEASEVASQIGNAAVGLTSTRVNTRDVGDRLFRLRSGHPLHSTTHTTPAPAPSAKGGLAKGGMAKQPIITTTPARWEVYGGLFFYTEENERDFVIQRTIPQPPILVFPPTTSDAPPTVQPQPPITVTNVFSVDTELDIFGGHVGVERRFSDNWRAGFAVAGSSSDLDTDLNGINVSSTEVDSITLMPYITYYRPQSLFGGDFWADLLYGYTDQDYDIRRSAPLLGLASAAETDGSTHTLDFNTGLNFGTGGSVVHGPFAGLRWIDGEIDGYTENIVGLGPLATFPDQDIESLASTLGYQVSIPIQTSGGTFIPQFRAAWEHEFEADAAVFGIPLSNVDEDIAVLGAGMGYYCNSGWNAVLDYEARIGSDVEGHYVGLKVGKEF